MRQQSLKSEKICSNCKRGNHHRCTGNWRANHGVKGPCECTSPEHEDGRVGTQISAAAQENA